MATTSLAVNPDASGLTVNSVSVMGSLPPGSSQRFNVSITNSGSRNSTGRSICMECRAAPRISFCKTVADVPAGKIRVGAVCFLAIDLCLAILFRR